jgi:hypothetical protein
MGKQVGKPGAWAITKGGVETMAKELSKSRDASLEKHHQQLQRESNNKSVRDELKELPSYLRPYAKEMGLLSGKNGGAQKKDRSFNATASFGAPV